MTLDEVLAKLENVRSNGSGYTARCAAHDDDRNSLSLKEADNGKILVKCFANCDTEAVVAALGMEMSDLTGDRAKGEVVVAKYSYHDAASRKLYTKVRYAPKDFRFTPRGYKGPRVPYRLPELLEAKTKKIVWVEGEKDADRLASLGLIATTAGGCNDWRAEMAPYFAGRDIVILPDNDDAGREHARRVATALSTVANRVTIAKLPGLPEHGDVSDFLDAHNNDRSALLAAIRSREEPFGANALKTFEEVETQSESWLWYPRIAYGAVTLVFGEAGIGKSTVMLDVLARLSRGDAMPQSTERSEPVKTIVVGIEGPVARTKGVLQACGANLKNVAVIEQQLTPEPELGPLEQLPYLGGVMRQFGARVLFVDNVAESMQSDTDSNNEFSVRKSLRRLTRFAEQNGYAVVMITHPKKGASFSDVKEAITGSQAFTNLPRATFFVAPIMGDDGRRTNQCAIACAKSNLYDAMRVNTLVYELKSEGSTFRDEHEVLSPPTVHWVGVIHRTAQELLEAMRPRKDSKQQDAPEVDAALVDIATQGAAGSEAPDRTPAFNAETSQPPSSLEKFLASESDAEFAARMMRGAEESHEEEVGY